MVFGREGWVGLPKGWFAVELKIECGSEKHEGSAVKKLERG